MTRRRTQGGVSARSGSAGVDRSGRRVQLDLPYGASGCVGEASNSRAVVARRAKVMQPSCSSSQVGAKGEEEAERFLGAGQKERGRAGKRRRRRAERGLMPVI